MNAAPSTSSALSRWNAWACLALAVLLTLVYQGVVGNDFVSIDDQLYLTQNPHVQRGWNRQDLAWAFTSGHASNWHPLTWFSHTLDWSLFGDWAGGHHLLSLAIHWLNCCLALIVVQRLMQTAGRQHPDSRAVPPRVVARKTGASKRHRASGERAVAKPPQPSLTAHAAPDASRSFSPQQAFWIALAVAVAFAVHPLHVESVAWASERKDVLSGLFWWLTIGAYVGWVERPRLGRYLLVFAMLLLGLMSKPMLVTLPFVLLLLDVWPLGRIPLARDGFGSLRRCVVEKAPLLALIVISSVVTYRVQRAAGAVLESDRFPLAARAAVTLAAYGQYLQTTVWPAGLNAFYPLPAAQLSRAPLSYAPAWIALMAIALLTAFCLWQWRRPYLLVGWLWFLGVLVPVVGIVKVGDQAAADRYMYLPLVGLVWPLACGLVEVAATRRAWSRPLITVGAALALVWSALSYRQVATWRDTETLARRALAVTKDNFVAHYLLGTALVKRDEPQAALVEFRRALEISPGDFSSRQDMATLLLSEGKADEARGHYEYLIKTRPDFDLGYAGMAAIHALERRYPEALEQINHAIALNRYDRNSVASRAEILLALGRPNDALPDFQAAHELGARDGEFRVKWVEAMLRVGQASEAEPLAARWLGDREFVLPDVHRVRAMYLLGEARKRQGNLAGCLEVWRQAAQLEPFSASLANDLAWTLATAPDEKVRDPNLALELAQRAAAHAKQPHAALFDTLAAAQASAGDFAAALATAERAQSMAKQSGDATLAADIAQRAELYRQGQPFRQPVGQGSPFPERAFLVKP